MQSSSKYTPVNSSLMGKSACSTLGRASLAVLLLLCAGLFVTTGCLFDSDDDDGPSFAGPKISGKNWSGFYYKSDGSDRSAITARITQQGEAVTIETDRTVQPAISFTGTVSTNGAVLVADAFDGENWSTYFGPATPNQIKLADFIDGPMGADNPAEFPLFIIELSR